MNVRTEIRRAERAMDSAPVQAVLACIGVLNRFPGNARARRVLQAMPPDRRRALLAEIAPLADAGYWGEALAVLAPIGRLHPTDPALAQAEARCLFHLHRYDQMRARLAAPLATHPDHPGLAAAMGAAIYGSGDAEDARAYLMRAAELAPDDPHIANHLGIVERGLGHLDAARAAFLRATEVSGGALEAWTNLSQMVDFAREPALLRRLDQLLERPGLSRAQREYLAFARAKAGFDLDEPESAFAWLDTANSLHRAAHPYDAAGDRARVTAIADRLGATRLNARTPGPRVILVVGVPRSGTTLLERILAAHPDVAGLGERTELADLVAGLDTGAPWTRAQLAELAQRYHAALPATDRPVVVDKMPSNALIAGFALAAMPDLHVVHIRRDPVATALSNLRTRYTTSNEFAYAPADIVERIALTSEMTARWADDFPDRVHDILYESLVDAPAPRIARLLDRLGLPPDPACTGFAGASGDVRTASAHQVRGPITRQRSADWKGWADHMRPLVDALAPFSLAHEHALAREEGI